MTVCPVCGGASDHALTARDRNRESTAATFEYDRCRACRTVFLADVPDDLSPFYTADYHVFDADGEPLWKRDGAPVGAAFRIGLLEHFVPPGHLIEIGAGAGAFATAALGAGFDVSAIEMDPQCCDYLTRAGASAICTDRPLDALAPLPLARVVALWHVLEHLRGPIDVLAAAAAKLEPGGILALAVPNPDSLQLRVLGARWPHLDAPRHLSLIPAETLIARGRELGLEPVALTTSDPDGRDCDLHGWAYALRRRPAEGQIAPLPLHAAGVLTRALAPVERRGRRGAAFTLVLRKGPG